MLSKRSRTKQQQQRKIRNPVNNNNNNIQAEAAAAINERNNNGNNSNKQPHMIEEEPPHEFYASLFGGKTCTATPLFDSLHPSSSSSSSSSSLATTTPTSSAVTIPPDLDLDNAYNKNIPTQQGKSIFTKVYHQALTNPPPPPTPTFSTIKLDKTNKGFKLLSQMGWNEQDGGLGKHRQGTIQPLKVLYKADKRGLGVSSKPLKRRKLECATIWKAEKEQTMMSSSSSKAKRRQLAKEKKAKEEQREKRIKMLLRTDLPPGYEDLYLKLHSS